ncbi:hypothetical protein C2857_003088 [Epichloe festucae Fl1]|uniref:Tetratricopeptide repeat protein 1 n=1 Tax=Epichloe festucae (strain Fl1) TaxID=877507 RepID=A0A7S9PWX2_EPIFF|nr:hypothetical protein C2857_003088 [Epichloe festucae Fl1]
MTGPSEQKDAAPDRVDAIKNPRENAGAEVIRFSPAEERALLGESNTIKAEANALYSAKDYENALSKYKDAISTCPNYLHYERAVIQSNMAACHLQLEQWKDAIKVATKALDGIAALQKNDDGPELAGTDDEGKQDISEGQKSSSAPQVEKADDEVDEEIVSSGATRAAPAPAPAPSSSESDTTKSVAETRKADVHRIRTKALLRRARARSEAGGWQNLAGAEEDYKLLSDTPGLLGPADLREVRRQLVALPPRTKAAQESEMSEMWGKLRTLGDGILKPFGLSTSNFQMVKDEKSGGYSMNFTSDDGESKST